MDENTLKAAAERVQAVLKEMSVSWADVAAAMEPAAEPKPRSMVDDITYNLCRTVQSMLGWRRLCEYALKKSALTEADLASIILSAAAVALNGFTANDMAKALRGMAAKGEEDYMRVLESWTDGLNGAIW